MLWDCLVCTLSIALWLIIGLHCTSLPSRQQRSVDGEQHPTCVPSLPSCRPTGGVWRLRAHPAVSRGACLGESMCGQQGQGKTSRNMHLWLAG